MASRIYAAESIQYRTADLIEEALGGLYTETDPAVVSDALSEFALECSVCKVFGSETLDMVSDEGLHLHGGYGFMQEYPIEQAYRGSSINRLFEGINDSNSIFIPGPLPRNAVTGKLDIKD